MRKSFISTIDLGQEMEAIWSLYHASINDVDSLLNLSKFVHHMGPQVLKNPSASKLCASSCSMSPSKVGFVTWDLGTRGLSHALQHMGSVTWDLSTCGLSHGAKPHGVGHFGPQHMGSVTWDLCMRGLSNG
jgi:hypothetical protein